MTEPRILTVSDDVPLIAVPEEEDGREVTRYFADEASADAFLPRHERIQMALSAIGSASDLDMSIEEMLEQLDCLRHTNPPSPLFEPEG
jgi:hypothetical protein